MGRAGILETCTRTADRTGKGGDRLILRDDALMQFLLDAEQLLGLFFLDRCDGNTGPAANDIFDVFTRHDAR